MESKGHQSIRPLMSERQIKEVRTRILTTPLLLKYDRNNLKERKQIQLLKLKHDQYD